MVDRNEYGFLGVRLDHLGNMLREGATTYYHACWFQLHAMASAIEILKLTAIARDDASYIGISSADILILT
jgi:hypothetical protein